MEANKFIRVKGARAHNLKNISVDIPRNELVIITGVSGSGKSSLAFDTIYAEGQRRYVESLSSYARQFLQMQDKPDVDLIEGLSPAISIEQKTTSKNPRSTVATVTEIYDYLRLLYARVGTPHCYCCEKPIKGKSASQIVEEIMEMEASSKITILAPIVKGQKGEHRKIIEDLRKDGFSRVVVDGESRLLEEEIILKPKQKHVIDVVIDRLSIEPQSRLRLAEAIELALKKGGGLAKVLVHQSKQDLEHIYSQHFACIDCGVSYAEIEPRTFSFNAPQGACPTCTGLGKVFNFDRRFEQDDRVPDEHSAICPECNGARLSKEALHVWVSDTSIFDLCERSITQAHEFVSSIKLSGSQAKIAQPILKEIASRLQFLLSVGLEYLTLNRSAGTLSGGEAQRIRLATQIGSALVGVLYVLDEPSIGLHQRDNEKLLITLRRLRDLGNTVLVVEHDEDTILAADYVLDMGPGAGRLGGEVVSAGTPEQIKADKNSLTGQYLNRVQHISVPKERRAGTGGSLKLKGARGNNLKNIDVDFPLGKFVCVTGVSGSGKSSLIIDTLYKQLAAKFYSSGHHVLPFTSLKGLENIDKVIDIDQSPIGRTPRSNPATYTGVFDDIRALFASLPDAAMRGYKVGRFSFNVSGGRCESCKGGGIICIEMNFLPDVYVTCEVCRGLRFNTETLSVRYRGKSISDVLEFTVDEARTFFSAIPSISRKLDTLQQVGLGYIHLGQQATTLSGGEAQRIKLSKELGRRATGKTFYILDEPTTGLHFHDVSHLLKVLEKLVDQGNTVVVIEHNLDVIKSADHVIDIGPEGGHAGGQVVAIGTPEHIATVKESHTGRFLRAVLEGN